MRQYPAMDGSVFVPHRIPVLQQLRYPLYLKRKEREEEVEREKDVRDGSSSESEGICADYASTIPTGPRAKDSMCSSMDDDQLWRWEHGVRADSALGRVCLEDSPKERGAGDAAGAAGTIGMSWSMTSSYSSSMHSSLHSTPLSSSSRLRSVSSSQPRPTRIPRPTRPSAGPPGRMCHSYSASPAPHRTMRAVSLAASAPCGSREQLCEGWEDARAEAQRVMERSRHSTPRRATMAGRADERCLLAPASMSASMLVSQMNASFHSHTRPSWLRRPRLDPFGADDLALPAAHRQLPASRHSSRPRSPSPVRQKRQMRIRGWTVRRNGQGGRKTGRVEQTLCMWRGTGGKCTRCRHEARLARMVPRRAKWTRSQHPGIGKPRVVRPSACRCARLLPSRPRPLASRSYGWSPLMDLAVLFAAIAFLLRILLGLFSDV